MGGCISTLCCGESADAGAAKAEDEQKLEIGVGVTQNGEAGFEIDPIRSRKNLSQSKQFEAILKLLRTKPINNAKIQLTLR